jgi:hypothetical protein
LFFDLILSSLSISSGGTNGGYNLVINGKGFPFDSTQATVTMCGATALITSISNTQTTIIVPPCTNGTATITYAYNNITKTISFTYVIPVIVPLINSVSPTSANPTKKGVMTILGSGFGSSVSDVTIYLANSTGKIYKMRVLSVNDSTILAGIPGGLPGNYSVQVSINGVGDIPPFNAIANLFAYQVSILSITPNTGSYYGGTLVTITGINFSPITAENVVSIGDELNDVCII